MKAIHERQKSLKPLALERLLLDNDDPILLADLKQEEEKPVLGCRSGRYLAESSWSALAKFDFSISHQHLRLQGVRGFQCVFVCFVLLCACVCVCLCVCVFVGLCPVLFPCVYISLYLSVCVGAWV